MKKTLLTIIFCFMVMTSCKTTNITEHSELSSSFSSIATASQPVNSLDTEINQISKEEYISDNMNFGSLI